MRHPGDRNHDEAPDEAKDGGHEADACADDPLDERNHGEDRAEEAQQGLEAGDDQDDAQDPEEPEYHLVGRFLVFEHVLGADGAHLHAGEGLAVLGDVAFERAVDHFLQQGDGLGRSHLGEGDPHVADVRRGRIGADVDLVVRDGDRDGRVGDLGQQLGLHGGIERRIGGLFTRDAGDDAVGKPVGAEGHVLRAGFRVVDGTPHEILAPVVGILEFVGVLRFAAPGGFVGVGRRCFRAAAELVLAFGFAVLRPLVVFYGAGEADGVDGDAEGFVAEDFVGGGHTGSVDRFAFESGIDGRYVGKFDVILLEIFQGVTGLDGTALVPPEDDRAGKDQDDTPQNPLEGALDFASVGLPCSFLESHNV